MTIDNIYLHLVKNKIQYIRLIWASIIMLAIVLVISVIFEPLHLYWNQLGRMAGNLALVSYTATIIPGILKRFSASGIIQKVQLIFMSFRRQLGIAMYAFAVYHTLWVRTLPSIKYHGNLLPQTSYELIGLAALLLTTPLFLTSNNISVKNLGPRWRILHKLTYLIVWLIFFHIAILGRFGFTTVLIYMTGILQVASLLLKQKGNYQTNQSSI